MSEKWKNTLSILCATIAGLITALLAHTHSFAQTITDAVDPKRQEPVAWLALPFGAGFPATISLSSEEAMIALAKIRYGEAGSNLKQVKLHQCHGQVTLINDLDGLSETDAHTIAMEAVTAETLF